MSPGGNGRRRCARWRRRRKPRCENSWRRRRRRTRFINTCFLHSGGRCGRRRPRGASRLSATFRSLWRRTRPTCGPILSCLSWMLRRVGRRRWRACRRITFRRMANSGAIRFINGSGMWPTASRGGMQGCGRRLSWATWCASTISAGLTPIGGFRRRRRRRARGSGCRRRGWSCSNRCGRRFRRRRLLRRIWASSRRGWSRCARRRGCRGWRSCNSRLAATTRRIFTCRTIWWRTA